MTSWGTHQHGGRCVNYAQSANREHSQRAAPPPSYSPMRNSRCALRSSSRSGGRLPNMTRAVRTCAATRSAHASSRLSPRRPRPPRQRAVAIMIDVLTGGAYFMPARWAHPHSEHRGGAQLTGPDNACACRAAAKFTLRAQHDCCGGKRRWHSRIRVGRTSRGTHSRARGRRRSAAAADAYGRGTARAFALVQMPELSDV